MRFKELKSRMILRRPIGHPVHHLFFIKSVDEEIVKLDVYTRSDNANPFEVEYRASRNSNQWNNYRFRFYDSEIADDKDFQEFIKGVFESARVDVMVSK